MLIRVARNQILITVIVVKNHLKPVHVDDGGGDGDDDTEQRREKADAATEFDLEQNILKSSGFNLYWRLWRVQSFVIGTMEKINSKRQGDILILVFMTAMAILKLRMTRKRDRIGYFYGKKLVDHFLETFFCGLSRFLAGVCRYLVWGKASHADTQQSVRTKLYSWLYNI